MQFSNLFELKDGSAGSAAFGLWAAAMMTFVAKDIPLTIWKAIRKQLVTALEVTSKEEEFVALTRWIERQTFSRSFRSIRARGRELSVGFGRHYFWHRSRLCWFFRERIEVKDGTELEEISISYLGRSQGFLRELVAEAVEAVHSSKETRIYVPKWSRSWTLLTSQAPRTMESVLLPDETREQVVGHLDRFFQGEVAYRARGIPYRTGLCLYGSPGTGKTSFVRALCAKYDLRLYALDLTGLTDQDVAELMWRVGSRSLVLMEDVDSIQAAQDRSIEDKQERRGTEQRVTLGGLLNAIDGVVESDGRVLVFTTNHVDRLDPALLRPGRVDLKVELKSMTPTMFQSALRRFAPGIEFSSETRWKDGMTPAEFQQVILKHGTCNSSILREVTYSS